MNFGKRLKQLREEKSLNQLELCEKLNEKNKFLIDRTTISKLENSRIQPTIDNLILIADYFGVSTDYLLGREEYDDIVKEYANKANQTYIDTVKKLRIDTLSFLEQYEEDIIDGRYTNENTKKTFETIKRINLELDYRSSGKLNSELFCKVLYKNIQRSCSKYNIKVTNKEGVQKILDYTILSEDSENINSIIRYMETKDKFGELVDVIYKLKDDSKKTLVTFLNSVVKR